MTQTLIHVAQALGVLALTYGLPTVGLLGAVAAWKRSKVRYHVGNPRVGVPVQTFRTKGAARKAAVELYRAHRKSFRITTTR